MNNKSSLISMIGILLIPTICSMFQTSFAQKDKSLEKLYFKVASSKSGHVKYIEHKKNIINDADTVHNECEIYFYRTGCNLNYIEIKKNENYTLFSCYIGNNHLLEGNEQFTGTIPFTSLQNQIAWSDVFITGKAIKGLFYEDEECKVEKTLPLTDWNNKKYLSNCLIQETMSEEKICLSSKIEYNPKNLNLVQFEINMPVMEYEYFSNYEFLNSEYYSQIEPFIIDTILSYYDKLTDWEYQSREKELNKRDSMLRSQILDSLLSTGWGQGIVTQKPKEEDSISTHFTAFSLLLLNGDTLHSDSIHARFLLLDFWYISCFPCMLLTKELVALDSVINDDWVKIVGINCTDKDVNKIKIHDEKFGVKYDVVYHGIDYANQFFRFCGGGFPQLYLIDMKTKQIIWHSCGYYKGITKDLEKMIVF